MSVKIGKYFEVCLRDRHISIPFIGACHFGSFGLVWDGCKEIKRSSGPRRPGVDRRLPSWRQRDEHQPPLRPVGHLLRQDRHRPGRAAIFGQSIVREVMDEVAKAWTKTVASRHTRRFWRAWVMKATSH
jgi:hypothetical protein